MTYDLINNSGKVLFSGYPLSDALAEQRWQTMTHQSPLRIVPHRKAKRCYQPRYPLSAPPKDLI